jgi:hypothetical protein
VSGLARRLDRIARLRARKLRAQLRGDQTVLVSVMSPVEALLDQRFAQGTAELLAVSVGSALGEIRQRSCFGCCSAWAPDRLPELVLLVEFLGRDMGLIAGICGHCSREPGLRDLLLDGLRRDLGAAVRRVVPIQEAGHA